MSKQLICLNCIDHPLHKAPKDRNILIRTYIMHWKNYDWVRSGTRWVECAWSEDRQRFEVWCGSPTSWSTETIHPIAWAELPENKND